MAPTKGSNQFHARSFRSRPPVIKLFLACPDTFDGIGAWGAEFRVCKAIPYKTIRDSPTRQTLGFLVIMRFMKVNRQVGSGQRQRCVRKAASGVFNVHRVFMRSTGATRSKPILYPQPPSACLKSGVMGLGAEQAKLAIGAGRQKLLRAGSLQGRPCLYTPRMRKHLSL
jgi:hypothetical protein